jgi:DNA-binding NarL/FixJ family response regulator
MAKILVVEDTPEFADAIQRTLALDGGYSVTQAARASEALAVAAFEQPDLVLLDLGLPDRDGYHVLEQLRARGHTCPVLILSARHLEADKLEGFRLGADDYVTKPFSALELLARISALLRRAGTGGPAAHAESRNLSDDELRERYGLTPRQVSVARLMAEGCSNAEIATRLSVSYYTARNHAEQVLAKFGVSTRAAIGALLFDNRPS